MKIEGRQIFIRKAKVEWYYSLWTVMRLVHPTNGLHPNLHRLCRTDTLLCRNVLYIPVYSFRPCTSTTLSFLLTFFLFLTFTPTTQKRRKNHFWRRDYRVVLTVIIWFGSFHIWHPLRRGESNTYRSPFAPCFVFRYSVSSAHQHDVETTLTVRTVAKAFSERL